MEDLKALRAQMVETQLVPRGISDPRVLAAFRKVARDEFVPSGLKYAAYDDSALPIGEDQTISQPYMVAIMTELLELKGSEKVLEIGTGSGYQAAILAELCEKVYTIERISALSKRAEELLEKLGYHNVDFVVGDGTEGYAAASPYDGIIVTAGCPRIPPPLIEQLAEGGRLVIPVGDRYQQMLTVVKKKNGRTIINESIACVFVPLVGKYGWRE